jgi:hypothetical protein
VVGYTVGGAVTAEGFTVGDAPEDNGDKVGSSEIKDEEGFGS